MANKAADSEPAANDGTPTNITFGKPGLVTGSTDTAIGLDGTTSYVDVVDSPSLDINKSFTMGALVEPSAVDGKRQIVCKTGTYWIQIDAGGLELAFVDTANTVHALAVPTGIASGALAHVVGTYDGQMLRAYVNGSLVGSMAATGTITTTTSHLFLGTWDKKSNFFGGVLDEVFIGNQAVDAAGVAALYASATRCASMDHDAGPNPTPDAGPDASDGGVPVGSMAVGLNGSPGQDPAEADLKNCVNYVRLENPATVSYEASIGLKVDVLTELGGYNGGGVSAIDTAAEVPKLVTWWQANCTAATCPWLEVLNEPSGDWFWGTNSNSAANALAYAKVLKAVHDAFVAQFGAQRPLILGSYENATWAQNWLPTGVAYVDGVVVHPYGGGCGYPVAQSAQGNRPLVQAAHMASGKPVYVTEVGWPTAVGQPCTGDSQQWSEADQATNITNFVTWAEGTGYVNMVMIFGYRDYGTNNWYGVERKDGTKKPSYAALHALATP
jgi:hypothetical protein